LMRVLITGGAGLIGKATTECLVEKGWDVRVVGIDPEADLPGADYDQCSVLDYDDLLKHTRGCDAVIHLAALRTPMMAPGHEVYEVNVIGTFNVFEAAAACGIKRVVQASSINALGGFYNLTDIEPRYFPVDEDHPSSTTDPYSFSKQTVEAVGAYYWRRDQISSVALRFPGVYKRGYLTTEGYQQRHDLAHQALAELLSLSPADRQVRLAEVRQRTMAFRQQRPFEHGSSQAGQFWQSSDPLLRMYGGDRFNFWTFIDERDAAQSLEKGVTADYDGAHPLFINDDHNAISYDSTTLIRLFFAPEMPMKRPLSGSESLVSIERARQLIGFTPEYSVAKLVQS
jgi:nucleoside-diphosphate-sugar epimerase